MKERLSFAERLKKGMREAIACGKGELELRTRTIELADPLPINSALEIQAPRQLPAWAVQK